MLLNEYRMIFGTSSYGEGARAYDGGGGGLRGYTFHKHVILTQNKRDRILDSNSPAAIYILH